MPARKSLPNGRAVWILLAAVNGIVLWNSLTHPPSVGYDAGAHLDYARALSEGRLPDREETYESHSAPLGYAVPAIFRAAVTRLGGVPGAVADRRTARFWLLWNVGISLALTTCLVRLCERIAPGSRQVEIVALGLVGTLPVYYKTFAQARAEPLVALLCLLSVEAAIRWGDPGQGRAEGAIRLGLVAGLAVLARQWNLPVALAIALFLGFEALRARGRRLREAGWLALACAVGLAVGGWFYLYLDISRGGMAKAFVAHPRGFSIFNQPSRFYLATGGATLFARPFRPAFRNELWPILYSETWGDYWGYFLVAGARPAPGGGWYPAAGSRLESWIEEGEPPGAWTNLDRMLPYLGRVNLVAILPSLILVMGLLRGARALSRLGGADPGARTRAPALMAFTVFLSLGAYFWFLVAFPELSKGGTTKSTYILHTFPLAAILAATWMRDLRLRAPRTHAALAILLLLAAAHNAPALVSRYGALFLGAGG